MINLHNIQREYQGQNVVTPWDRLKRFMFNSYPVIKTPIKITDEDTLLEAAAVYKDKADMVWVVFDDIEVNPRFLCPNKDKQDSGDGDLSSILNPVHCASSRQTSTLAHRCLLDDFEHLIRLNWPGNDQKVPSLGRMPS